MGILKSDDLQRGNLVFITGEHGIFQVKRITRSHCGVRSPKRNALLKRVLTSELMPIKMAGKDLLEVYIDDVETAKATISGKECVVKIIKDLKDSENKNKMILVEEYHHNAEGILVFSGYSFPHYGGKLYLSNLHEIQNLYFIMFSHEMPISKKAIKLFCLE